MRNGVVCYRDFLLLGLELCNLLRLYSVGSRLGMSWVFVV